MADTSYLPRWQSHKIVHAAIIDSVSGEDIHLWVPPAGAGHNAPFNVPVKVKAAPKMFDRYMPVPGDYYVVYEDGYASISPRQAFEDGYHRL